MSLLKFKNLIGANLFAVAGWVGVILSSYWAIQNNTITDATPDNVAYRLTFSLMFYVAIFLLLISISLIVGSFEIILGKKITNKFILENKFYNIFWIVGVFLSFLCLLSPVIIFFF